MKKYIVRIAIAVFAVALVFGMVACGGNDTDKNNPADPDKTYTVTFDSGSGTSVPSQTVSAGGKVTKPTDPVDMSPVVPPDLLSMVFVGWYKEDGVTLWNFDSDTVNSDITLYARWAEQSAASIKEVEDATIKDDGILLAVSDESADLSDKITLYNENAVWKLCDASGNEIADKTAKNLVDGDNAFTVVVNYDNSAFEKTYNLTIHKKYEVSIKVIGLNDEPMTEYDFKLMTLDVLTAPSDVEIPGYTVNATATYWTSSTVKVGEVIPKDSPKEITLTVKPTPKKYKVVYYVDENANTSLSFSDYCTFGQPIKVRGEIKNTSYDRDGYVFLGWENKEYGIDTDENGNGVGVWTFTEDKTYRLNAKYIGYTVTTEKDMSEAGTITQMNETVKKPGSTVTIEATTNVGYVWLGWFDEEDNRVSEGTSLEYEFTMTANDRVFLAKWYYPVAINEGMENAGEISGLNGAYVLGDTATLTASVNVGYLFTGWKNKQGTIVSTDLSYNLEMNGEVITAFYEVCENHTLDDNCVCTKCGVVAHNVEHGRCAKCLEIIHLGDAVEHEGYCRVTENGTEYIYFGFYPQTIKASDVTVKEESCGGASYYINTKTFEYDTQADYMESTPISYYMGSDGYKYAKVTAVSGIDGKYSSGDPNVYIKGNGTYYFKVEPIRWRILEKNNETGTALLLCDSIIECQPFCYSYNPKTYAYNSSNANDYYYSTIRAWLRGKFSDIAFDVNQKDKLVERTFLCEYYKWKDNSDVNTSQTATDKVFLMSTEEIKGFGFANSLSDDSKRKMKPSDFSIALGIGGVMNKNGCASYWLRSYFRNDYPHYYDYVRTVNYNGGIAYGIVGNGANLERKGVVPAITIKL